MKFFWVKIHYQFTMSSSVQKFRVLMAQQEKRDNEAHIVMKHKRKNIISRVLTQGKVRKTDAFLRDWHRTPSRLRATTYAEPTGWEVVDDDGDFVFVGLP